MYDAIDKIKAQSQLKTNGIINDFNQYANQFVLDDKAEKTDNSSSLEKDLGEESKQDSESSESLLNQTTIKYDDKRAEKLKTLLNYSKIASND